MGFMLRVILGLTLVLTTFKWLESAPAPSNRYIRQLGEEEAVPEIPSIEDAPFFLNETTKEDFSNNNIINQTLVVNDNSESNVKLLEDEKPKTGNNKQFSDVNYSEVNKKTEAADTHEDNLESHSIKINTSTTTEEVPEIKQTVAFREENARSIDITKYVSPEFHDKNNIYSLSVSPDTEKYTNLHNDILNFSTTESYDFDKKQRDIETDVKQKLKYIDEEFENTEKNVSPLSSSANITFSEILNKPQDNDTITDLDYVKYKNITSQFNKVKNKINKETDIESGESINYNSTFNKSHVYDETPKDYKNKISSYDHYDLKFPLKVTTETGDAKKSNSEGSNDKLKVNQKDVSLITKPPFLNKTANDHLISNKIENEVLTSENISKSKNDYSYFSTTLPITTPYITTIRSTEQYDYEKFGKENVVTIAKRGSTKYVDTIQSTTPIIIQTNKENGSASKYNHTMEEVVQENQVYPVQVPAPAVENITQQFQTEAEIDYTLNITNTESTTAALTEQMIESTTMTIDSTTLLTTTVLVETTTTSDATIEFETTSTEPYTFTTTESTQTTTDKSIEYTHFEQTETVPVTGKSNISTEAVVELDRETSGRGFNFGSTEFTYETVEDRLSNTSVLPTTMSQSLTTTTSTLNNSSVEIVSTTTDYRDNVIIKHVETTTIKSHLLPKANFSDSSAEENETFKEVSKKSTDSGNTQGTTKWYSIRTHAFEQTSETTPFIIPLNMSMYDVDAAETTTGNLGLDDPEENNGGKIAAIVISSIGAVCLILLAGLLFIMRKRHKRFNYGQRCTPVSLDAYSVDNVSVYNSLRRKGAARASKRSYGNLAFDDPSSITNPLNFPGLSKFSNNTEAILAEFEEVPQVTAQTNELPEGCETKNRYANVIPLPETRVFLSTIEGYPNSDYINANYVTGPKSTKSYYIACQAPMQNTVEDFWRMVWEQQSKVILMLTHFYENGSEKCVDYLPPSEVLDCHRLFGDFQITLKNREVKEKYVISVLQLKNMVSNSWREVTHLWYLGWPEKGVPSEANSLIAFLIEARSYIKALPPGENGKSKDIGSVSNGNANLEHSPVIVHCSPGTGRTGTVIACDIAIREFELARQVDIPKTVYKIRRDRASSVQTKEQYQFIYNVITLYATKLTGGVLDSL